MTSALYSQNDEQVHILREFEGFTGTFLDIGACDGRLNSNTLALVELGWSGILVEPSPQSFVKLHALHGNNPKLTLIHAAVGLTYGLTPFWDGPIGYSTTEPANLRKWQHLGFAESFLVPLIALRAIERHLPTIDFLSIDTEGTSVELFLNFEFISHPRLICVEHDGEITKCQLYAARMGYTPIAQNAENLIFKRKG